MTTPVATRRFAWLDGVALDLDAADIAQWVHETSVSSTMDRAHALAAEGAPAGTLAVADVQQAGRGRGGKTWASAAGDGLWCTLIERITNRAALDVLSLRLGLAVVEAVAPWCDGPVGLKWPNDVLVVRPGAADGRETVSQDASTSPQAPASPQALPSRPPLASLHKLAGVLAEARWRDATVEWVAIGVGINLRVPSGLPGDVRAAALVPGVTRAEVLAALVPRLRTAARVEGTLTAAEQAAWAARDLAAGRPCTQPEPGIVQGIDASGALLVAVPDDSVSGVRAIRAHRSGSLVFSEEDIPC